MYLFRKLSQLQFLSFSQILLEFLPSAWKAKDNHEFLFGLLLKLVRKFQTQVTFIFYLEETYNQPIPENQNSHYAIMKMQRSGLMKAQVELAIEELL